MTQQKIRVNDKVAFLNCLLQCIDGILMLPPFEEEKYVNMIIQKVSLSRRCFQI